MILNQNSSNPLRIYIDLDSLLFLSKKEVSLDFHLCFIRRFDLESLELFDFDSVCWFLDWNSEINRWFFLLLLRRFKTFEILSLFFSNFASVIVLSSLLLVTNLMLELQRTRLNDDDSTLNHWELTQTPLIWLEFCFWKFRVCELVLQLFWVCCDFDLTEWRERVGIVFVMWRNYVDLLFWLAQYVALYRLPCGLWTNENMTPGLDH